MSDVAHAVLAPYDREALRAKFRCAKPFPWIEIDGFLQPGIAAAVEESYPSFDVATGLGRLFQAVNERRKVQIVDCAKFPDPVKQLSDALSSARFLEDLSYATGIPNLMWDPEFAGAGMHETTQGGWLDVHVDFNYHKSMRAHRRLNILVFLNPVWRPEWGGSLEFWDLEVKQLMHDFAPLHNRCVIFETSEISWHGVSAVRCPEGFVRKSFAAYYYTREAPAGGTSPVHSTRFKARPDEHIKRHLLMPAEAARGSLRAALRAAKRAAKRMLGSK